MERWVVHPTTTQLRDTSAADYRIQAKKVVAVLGPKRLKDLTPLDFQSLYTALVQKDYPVAASAMGTPSAAGLCAMPWTGS